MGHGMYNYKTIAERKLRFQTNNTCNTHSNVNSGAYILVKRGKCTGE